MLRASTCTVKARAIIGVIALYALLLQGLLAAAMPPVRPDMAGVICAPHDGSASSPDQPMRHDHPCCTAAQTGALTPPPAAPVVSEWTFPSSTAVRWRPEAALRKTGPPTHSHSARGPPSA